jgi:hypothetical protein
MKRNIDVIEVCRGGREPAWSVTGTAHLNTGRRTVYYPNYLGEVAMSAPQPPQQPGRPAPPPPQQPQQPAPAQPAPQAPPPPTPAAPRQSIATEMIDGFNELADQLEADSQ